MTHVPVAEIAVIFRLAKVEILVGGPWQKSIFISELRVMLYAKNLGSLSHPVSPPPLVALNALSHETAPPLQGLCKGFQTPLGTTGCLSREIILTARINRCGVPNAPRGIRSTASISMTSRKPPSNRDSKP
jgi:hypothetical protein